MLNYIISGLFYPIAGWPFGPVGDVRSSNNLVFSSGRGIVIYDGSSLKYVPLYVNSNRLSFMGDAIIIASNSGIFTYENTLDTIADIKAKKCIYTDGYYVAGGDSLFVLNNTGVLSYFNIYVKDIASSQDIIYVASGNSGIYAFFKDSLPRLVLKEHYIRDISQWRAYSANSLFIEDSIMYVAAGKYGVDIILIQDSLEHYSSFDTYYYAYDVLKYKDRLYIADGRNGLNIVDIHALKWPSLIDTVFFEDIALSVSLFESSIAVGTQFDGLHIFDENLIEKAHISVPGSVRAFCNNNFLLERGIYSLYSQDSIIKRADGNFFDMAKYNNNYYVLESGGLYIYDSCFNVMDSISSSLFTRMDIYKELLIVSALYKGVYIYSLDKATPYLIYHITSDDVSYMAKAYNDKLYIADGEKGLKIYSIKDPYNPCLVKSIAIEGCLVDLLMADSSVYIVDRQSGVLRYNISTGVVDTFLVLSTYPETIDFSQMLFAVGSWYDGVYLYSITGRQEGHIPFKTKVNRVYLQNDTLTVCTVGEGLNRYFVEYDASFTEHRDVRKKVNAWFDISGRRVNTLCNGIYINPAKGIKKVIIR